MTADELLARYDKLCDDELEIVELREKLRLLRERNTELRELLRTAIQRVQELEGENPPGQGQNRPRGHGDGDVIADV
jgi:hypothetical protein